MGFTKRVIGSWPRNGPPVCSTAITIPKTRKGERTECASTAFVDYLKLIFRARTKRARGVYPEHRRVSGRFNLRKLSRIYVRIIGHATDTP